MIAVASTIIIDDSPRVVVVVVNQFDRNKFVSDYSRDYNLGKEKKPRLVIDTASACTCIKTSTYYANNRSY